MSITPYITMCSHYFLEDTLQCKYKIYNDTLDFTLLTGYALIAESQRFFLVKRKE